MTLYPVDDNGIDPNGLTAAVRERILDTYLDRLVALGSPIVDNPVWLEQARHQAEAVLDDLSPSGLSEAGPGFDRNVAMDPLSAEIGGTRAMTGIHPAESLNAATVLYAIVLEELIPPESTDVRRAIALSEVLHGSIMRRIGVATISYASFLLKKVHGSHLEERRRMARELHDRAAHMVGVGLQNLELHGIYLDDQPERSAVKLETAKTALREALWTVRALSAELGSAVGTDGLVAALGKYLKVSVPPGIDIRFSSTGDDRILPDTYSEELYLVLREAVRNALLHGDPNWVEINLDIDGISLRGLVRDDGDGFDVEAALKESRGVGLTSMRERMELLGGSLTISSTRGGGTAIEATVQIPDRLR